MPRPRFYLDLQVTTWKCFGIVDISIVMFHFDTAKCSRIPKRLYNIPEIKQKIG